MNNSLLTIQAKFHRNWPKYGSLVTYKYKLVYGLWAYALTWPITCQTINIFKQNQILFDKFF